MYPSHLTDEELFKKEEWIPNLATDLIEAGLVISYIEKMMAPFAKEIDQLALVGLLSEAKARYYLKVAKGEIKDPTFKDVSAAQRAVAYLKRSGRNPEDVGTTESELLSLSTKMSETPVP